MPTSTLGALLILKFLQKEVKKSNLEKKKNRLSYHQIKQLFREKSQVNWITEEKMINAYLYIISRYREILFLELHTLFITAYIMITSYKYM